MTTTTTTTTNEAEAVRDALGLRVPEALGMIDRDALPEGIADRLAALVPPIASGPDPDGVSGYVIRTIDGVRDLDLFAIALDNRRNVLLTGPTGSAKTSAARAFAAVHGLPFVAIPVNGGIDPGAVWGRWIVGADGRLSFEYSPAALVVRYGGVLVLDEANMMHPRIAAAFHELLDVRRTLTIAENGGEVVRASAALLIVATMNPGYDGTARLNQAFARRFAGAVGWSIVWGYDPAVEAALVPSESLRDFAASVRDLPEVRTDLSTDALVGFVENVDLVGADFAAARLVAGFSEAERGGVSRALELRLPAIVAELLGGPVG